MHGFCMKGKEMNWDMNTRCICVLSMYRRQENVCINKLVYVLDFLVTQYSVLDSHERTELDVSTSSLHFFRVGSNHVDGLGYSIVVYAVFVFYRE